MAADSDSSTDIKMAINGPVFFLIQEQAKSVVAIQALQSRMAVLENLQERLMQAIDDIQRHVKPPKLHDSSTSVVIPSKSLSKPTSPREKKLRFASLAASSDRKATDLAALATNSIKSDSKSDSLNKDSGIGNSDTSLVPSESNKNGSDEEEDELLHLLDLIDRKSLMLLQQVEGQDHPPEEGTSSASGMGEASSSELLDNLLFEKVDTSRQLSEVKAERDELSRRLAELELATKAVTKEKSKVQEQLEATLLENQTLQEKIAKASETTHKCESNNSYLADIERANVKRKYLQYSEKSKRRVSSILKETNVLELQKQLLTYIMENDVLRAKLQQDQPSRLNNWLKVESRLKKELKEALEDKKRLEEIVQSKDFEIASLKDRIRTLEDTTENEKGVTNFGMESTEDWREPGVQNVYSKRSNLNRTSYSPLGYGDFSKTQSLPAMLFLGTKARLKEDKQKNHPSECGPIYDTNDFTEIPLDTSLSSSGQLVDHSSSEDPDKDLVDLSSPTHHKYSSTVTLVQSHYLSQSVLPSGTSVPNLNGTCDHRHQNWSFASRKVAPPTDVSGTKLVNGHLCWKGTSRLGSSISHANSQKMSSICTEFDPLSETPSCENFVDSLNLSIPLKPTQVAISQLSSIGDSLHSASLDLGCASCPQDSRKMNNARSVDGIRELLIDGNYYKGRTHAQYGQHHSVTPLGGKTTRHLPNNLIACMHDSSDYSLL